MTIGSKYVKIIEWSDTDQCFIGSCPELFYGGCHGDNEQDVFAALCSMIDDVILLYQADQKPLPLPLTSKELVNVLQSAA